MSLALKRGSSPAVILPDMVVELRGIRVFIATPGGLDIERRRFREVILALNEDDAHARGVSFIPVGWELSAAGLGRPQEKINDDVRTSDYLVLVLWDRWGTPPSIEGPYTSGTEEQRRSGVCRQRRSPYA